MKGVIISKKGDLRSTAVTEADIPTLHKRCGYRSSKGFRAQGKWQVGGGSLVLYAKMNGKAGSENKAELPPPLDKELFFGNMVVLARDSEDKLVDLLLEDWEKERDALFGGFDDLAASAAADEEEEDELSGVDQKLLTKTGYLKDGWIVDDGDDSGLEEEEYYPES